MNHGMFAIGLLSILLSGCSQPSVTYRQKMTVEVETPEGIKTGSAVSEVSYTEPSEWMRGFGANGNALLGGEAVAVDLPGGKTLFALLVQPPEGGEHYMGSDYLPDLLSIALLEGAKASKDLPIDTVDGVDWLQMIADSGVKVELPKTLYPLLVTFGDNSDPTSVKRVEPGDLAASFGAGVRLKAITVEVTDEAVGTGIGKRLVWFNSIVASGGGLVPMQRVNIDGASRYKVVPGHDDTLANVGTSDFSAEIKK